MMTTITERDKKLLLLVACALILVVCVQYLILPAQEKQNELEIQLDTLTVQKAEWEMQLVILDTIGASIETNTKARAEASEPYKTWMDNRQIDELITNLALEKGLFPQELRMTAPAPGAVADYPYYTPATERTLIPQGYVQVGTAQLVVQGTMDQWEDFIDTVSDTMPNLRITQFQVSPQSIQVEEDGQTLWNHSISGVLEIYMCVPGEEAA